MGKKYKQNKGLTQYAIKWSIYASNYKFVFSPYSDEEYDQNAAQLPDKVDEFLDFINNMYFDGEMDTKSKGVLKQDSSSHLAPRIIYSSDNETGTSPKILRKFH